MGCLFTGTFSLACFLFGWLIFPGGFGGAVIGLLIGTLIDLIINSRKNHKAQHYYKAQDFTEHELILAAYVAKADNNRLLQSELEYVRRFLNQNMSASQAQAALLRFRDILNSNIDIQQVCAELRQHATIYEKMMILQFLFGFSRADGDMRTEEVNAIQYISDLCGVSRTTYESIKSMFMGGYYRGGGGGYYEQQGYGGGSSSTYTSRTASDADYRILEVSPDATDEEVKKAYRAAAKKHHPDKVSHLGEDVRKAAEEKFAQVNEAYERIKKARGIV